MQELWLDDYREFFRCACRQGVQEVWNVAEISMAACSSCLGFWVGCAVAVSLWFATGKPTQLPRMLRWGGVVIALPFLAEQLLWRFSSFAGSPSISLELRYCWGVVAAATSVPLLLKWTGSSLWGDRDLAGNTQCRWPLLRLLLLVVMLFTLPTWGVWGARVILALATVGLLFFAVLSTATILRTTVLKTTSRSDVLLTAAVVAGLLLYLLNAGS